MHRSAFSACALWFLAIVWRVNAKALESTSEVASLFREECLPFSFEDRDGPSFARFAIILSGSSRTFYEAWPSLHRLLMEKNDVDVFASINLPLTAKKFDCWQFASLLATGKVRSLVVHKKSADDVIAHVNKTSNPSFPYSDRRTPHYDEGYYRGVLLQHYWNNEAYESMKRHETEIRAHPYDLVIRVRPDVMYLNPDLSSLDLDALQTFAEHVYGDRYSYVPDSNEFGGVTDAFALVSRGCADAYFKVLHAMETYLTKEQLTFHPETMMKHALVTRGECKLVLLEDALQRPRGDTHAAERLPFDYCIVRKGICNRRPAPLPQLTCAYPSEHGDWEGWASVG